MEPQTCTKCHSLPEDILMLACSHDLCLNCASDRLAFEMKKKKPANSIVCEFCYERTPLDSESVSELEKLMNTRNSRVNPRSDLKPYEKSSRQPEQAKFSYDHGSDRNADKFEKPYDRAKDRNYDRPAPKDSGISYGAHSNIVTAKKQCTEHPEEDILYFCFDCKCECICPECVIHGKHKDHDVKTIKKAHPIVKSEFEKNIEKFQNNIESLLIKKSEVQKNIRSINQQSNLSKRQIQQAFEEIRSQLDLKEKQIVKTCDHSLDEGLEELDKYVKGVVKRIDEIKLQCGTTQQFLKRDELTSLNHYARRWKELAEEGRDADVVISPVTFPSNQIILASVLDLTDNVARIGVQRSSKYHG